MRIVYHVPCEVVGGAEKQLQYLLKHLDHSVLITYQRPEIEPWLKTLGVPIKRTVSPIMFSRVLSDFRPDIVQFFHSKMCYDGIRKTRGNFKVVEVIHNRHPFYFDSSTYPKDHTDMCVCVSSDAQANLLSRMPGAKTIVIPNGIDRSRFKPVERLPKPVRGGYTGRLEGGNGKGIQSLLDLMTQFDVDFDIVGQDLANWGPIINASENIFYFPHTDTPEQFYNGWDFFVSYSPNEGFGLSIAEALSCGLPSVIYDCGGVCNYIEHGKHAFLANSPEEMVKYVKQVLSGDHNLEPTTLDMSSEAMAKRYDQLYSKLLIGKSIEVPIKKPVVEILENKPKILGITPASWSGIRQSLLSLGCTDIVDPTHAKAITECKAAKTVIFGGWNPKWLSLADAAKSRGAHVSVTLQHTFSLNEFGAENRDAMASAIQALKDKKIHSLMTPHYGLARALSVYDVPCEYYENSLLMPRPAVAAKAINPREKDEWHIGIFGSNAPWKNVESQIIGASMGSKNIIHAQSKGTPVTRALGIEVFEEPKNLTKDEFYNLVHRMDITMSVSFTESFGYFAVESFLLGTPCIISPMVSAFEDCPSTLDSCIVQQIDNPQKIADAITMVKENYDQIAKAGKEFCMQYVVQEK